MLHAIDDSNLTDALSLLREGFPERDEGFWPQAIARMHASGGNAKAELPVGYILKSKDVPAGIILTPSTVRIMEDGEKRRVVNFSSWYVQENHRWRAPLMMRQLLNLENSSFTDLTPTDSVQTMLRAFGFERINRGVSINLLPWARLKRPRAANVVAFGACDPPQIATATRDELEAHRQFDCLVAYLVEENRRIPLVFKRVRGRRIPSALLVYSEDNAAVYRNLAAIGQFLAQERIHLLMLDIPTQGQIPGIARRKQGNKFVRGMKPGNQTDYLGTELSLFDW